MIEQFYNFILKPKHNLYGLLEKKPYGLIIGVLIFSQLSTYISDLLSNPSIGDLKIILSSGFISHLISFIIFVLISSTIIHSSARFLGGHEHGKFRILLTAIGLSLFPSVLKTPSQILFGAFGENAFLLLSFSKLAILGWIIYLQVLAIKSIYLISIERSIIAYISPLLALTFILFLVGISTLIMIIFVFKGLISIFV